MKADIEHVGIWVNRTEPDYGYREKIYAEKWKEMNELDCCTRPTLVQLLNSKHSSFPQITQRDATVTATVIQWLGSNVGNCFVQECLKEIGKQREQDPNRLRAYREKVRAGRRFKLKVNRLRSLE